MKQWGKVNSNNLASRYNEGLLDYGERLKKLTTHSWRPGRRLEDTEIRSRYTAHSYCHKTKIWIGRNTDQSLKNFNYWGANHSRVVSWQN